MADALEARVVNAEKDFADRAMTSADAGATPRLTKPGLANAASNVCLALLFFVGLIPGIHHYASGVADVIWAVGAGLMGLFSLVRVPPKTVTVNIRTISATAGMMMIPTLMQPSASAAGLLYKTGVVVELAGVLFTQAARVYLGRSFGLLPANRGIVSSGPFCLVRHPIYSGWLMLTIGYTMIYPRPRNVLVILAVLPFMIWRIAQEEALLSEDAGYRTYMQRVRCRLVPYLL